MWRSAKALVDLGLLAGFLPATLAFAGKPTPTPTPKGCPTCEIVYTKDAKGTTGRRDLMLMTKEGASKTTLLAGSGGVGHSRPSWAPDGQWIAFYTTTNAGGSVQVIRNDGAGLTTVATTCTAYSRGQAWRPVSINNGFWMVYLDARRSDGTCIVETSPYRSNLWAVDVSLGLPVLTGRRVCLTCELNPDDADLWTEPAWSRDGNHFSAHQHRHDLYDNLYVFDVSFEVGYPVLGHAWPFLAPERDPLYGVSWAHWSDSVLFRTDVVNFANDLVKYQVDLVEEPEVLGGKTNLTAGSTVHFWDPRWSADDEAVVSRVGSTGSTATDGIYVITLNPFSMRLIASSAPTDVNNPDWKPPVR